MIRNFLAVAILLASLMAAIAAPAECLCAPFVLARAQSGSSTTTTPPDSIDQSHPSPSTPNSPPAPVKSKAAIKAPVLIHSTEPQMEFSWFGLRSEYEVLVGFIVPPDGKPTNLKIINSAGAHFDAAAIDAVSHYRFKPAMQAGQPITVELHCAVKFARR